MPADRCSPPAGPPWPSSPVVLLPQDTRVFAWAADVATTRVSAWLTVAPAASCTVTVTTGEPAVVGNPASTPPADKVSPAGTPTPVQVYGASPPEAVRVVVYGVPTRADVRVDVATARVDGAGPVGTGAATVTTTDLLVPAATVV